MCIKVHMSDYQQNCWLNYTYDFMANVIETIRGSLKDKADEYIKMLRYKGITRRNFLSQSNNIIASEATLQKAGIADPQARKQILDVILHVMPRVLRFSKLQGVNEPNLPMRIQDEIQIDSTVALRRALAEW